MIPASYKPDPLLEYDLALLELLEGPAAECAGATDNSFSTYLRRWTPRAIIARLKWC